MRNSRLNTLERQKPFTYRERKRIVTDMSRLLYQVNKSMIYLCEEFNKLSLVHFCESLEVFDPKKDSWATELGEELITETDK